MYYLPGCLQCWDNWYVYYSRWRSKFFLGIFLICLDVLVTMAYNMYTYFWTTMRWHALRGCHVPGMHEATSISKITILPSLKLTFFLYFSPHEQCVMGIFWSTVRHWQAIFGDTRTADGLTVMPAVNYDEPHHPSPSRWLGISPESDHYDRGCDCATLSYSTLGPPLLLFWHWRDRCVTAELSPLTRNAVAA